MYTISNAAECLWRNVYGNSTKLLKISVRRDRSVVRRGIAAMTWTSSTWSVQGRENVCPTAIPIQSLIVKIAENRVVSTEHNADLSSVYTSGHSG